MRVFDLTDMAEEAMVAQAQNVTSPVHPTIEATHQAYDAAVESVLRSIAHAALMVASHNVRKSALSCLTRVFC